MKSLAPRLPSPAMIVALTALFIAMGGTGYAATQLARSSGAAAARKHKHRTQPKSTNDTAADSSLINRLARGLTVASATNATNATHATNADNATTATSASTASDSSSLGGVAASGYAQNSCSSNSGAIKGYALIPGSGSFSASFAAVSTAYNCSGQAVQAERISTGVYEVKFLGNPSTLATGNIVDDSSHVDDAFASFQEEAAGDFKVYIYNAVLGGSSAGNEDRPFSVIIP